MFDVTDTYKTLIKQPTRYVGISGAVMLRSGTVVQFTDKNIKNIVSGSLSITDRLNRRGDFRPGGVYSSGLSIGFTGLFARTNDLDGAVIRLNYHIYPNAEMKASEAQTVPLGRFYVDGSTIKRTRSTVRLKADDGLMLFDVPATERSGTLYELVTGACAAAGVGFAMSQEEFEALPNATLSATINTARVQNERDLLMYVGMITGSFARITRSALALEFVPLTCEKDGSTHTIIPVREIAGNIRFKTDFSDDTTRISKLLMRRNGTALYSTYNVTATGSEKLATLELDENPLLSALTDDEVKTALNALLAQIHLCLNRVFDAEFTGDPALEVGDYVRLRGGEIDTDRGYATGMITSQTWTYHGTHRIQCSMPSSLVYSGEESAVMLRADDEETTTTTVERVQPKSQLEKQVDELRAGLAKAGGVGMKSPLDSTSEIFNCYDGGNVAGESGQKCFTSVRGKNNTAIGGPYNDVWGYNNKVNGSTNTVGGQSNDVNGYLHTVIGNGNVVSNMGNTVFGDNNTLSNHECFVIGYGNKISAGNVFAFGRDLTTNPNDSIPQILLGSNNIPAESSNKYAITVATSLGGNHNIFTLDWDGNIVCNSVTQTGAAASAALLSDDTADTPTYTAQSDNVVEYDGVTYTFTVADTGEYTGVTTSTGKSMTANIPAGLGNIQTHNAAFMALAMMSLK